ncbi:hypothetical protein ACO0K9_14290 [Undibacterium sp. Ji50W]
MIVNEIEVAELQDSDEYETYIQRINDRFNTLTEPIFETDSTGLYDAYLNAFTDAEDRQCHTCSCCKRFIERFGKLATISDDGELVPVMWNVEEAPERYKRAVEDMSRLVRRSKIVMPFLSSSAQYGTAISRVKDTGLEWHHFSVRPVKSRIFKGTGLKNAFQSASEKREEYGSVCQALSEYNKDTVAIALNLLNNDQLGNSVAAVGQAQFLADLHAITAASAALRNNLVYRAVAVAPSGFCHPRSSMISTLLDDIAAGKSFEQAQAAWNAKMHPLAYMRPKAAPTTGAIKAAEESIAKLGAASALKRRYARLDDILEKLWEPRATTKPEQSKGIFSSIRPKEQQSISAFMRGPAITMTWDKFNRTVLPTADAVEFYAPKGKSPYVALTTASDPDAIPILQWDSVERRNPVALYLWDGGSTAESFGLSSGKFHKVNAITLRPSMWFGDKFSHQGAGAILLINGAKDSKPGAGNALFPSTLKSEYHAVRSVIEAFSKDAELGGRDEATACGFLIGKEATISPLLRVTSAGQVTEYKIDRWD